MTHITALLRYRIPDTGFIYILCSSHSGVMPPCYALGKHRFMAATRGSTQCFKFDLPQICDIFFIKFVKFCAEKFNGKADCDEPINCQTITRKCNFALLFVNRCL